MIYITEVRRLEFDEEDGLDNVEKLYNDGEICIDESCIVDVTFSNGPYTKVELDVMHMLNQIHERIVGERE